MPFDDIVFLLTLALYGVAVWNCVKVLGSRGTSSAAIAWILLHLTAPWIAVPLYFLVGDFRIKGYTKRHRAASSELESEGALVLPARPPEGDEVVPAIRETYTSFRAVFRKFGAVFEPQPGQVELLVDGRQTFDAIFKAVAEAKHYIFVQYYILRHDRLGLELKRLLVQKVKAGVPVYMLYDDMGSFWLSREYIRDLRRSGVKVARFLPIATFKRFFQMNFRNHRKLVIVDGVTAFTGGLNVGEEYAARRSRRSLLRYWRDTHVRLTGGSVTQLEDIFLEDWYFATGEKLDVATRTHAPPLPTPAAEATPHDQLVQVIPTGPTDHAVLSILFVLHLINSAKARLWIASPYFVPDPAIIRGLELAALRGVDVRLILPRVSDNRFVHWVSLSYADQMQSRGVSVLLYETGFMHQKVILVDETLAAVGTMNMDNRAMYLNFETMVLIHGEAFNRKVVDMLQKDFLDCRFLKADGRPHVRALKKLRGNACRLFAPLL